MLFLIDLKVNDKTPLILIKSKMHSRLPRVLQKIKNAIERTGKFTCKSSTELLKLDTISKNAYRAIIRFFNNQKPNSLCIS